MLCLVCCAPRCSEAAVSPTNFNTWGWPYWPKHVVFLRTFNEFKSFKILIVNLWNWHVRRRINRDYLSIYLQSIYLSTICLSVYLSIRLSIYLAVYLSIYLSIYHSIYLWLYSPLLDSGCFFTFLIALHSRQDSLDGGSARRKAATCTQDNTNTEQTHTDSHASSEIRTHDPSVWADRAKTVHAVDRAATVIGTKRYYIPEKSIKQQYILPTGHYCSTVINYWSLSN
jgi:hypothetical protein